MLSTHSSLLLTLVCKTIADLYSQQVQQELQGGSALCLVVGFWVLLCMPATPSKLDSMSANLTPLHASQLSLTGRRLGMMVP